MKFVILDHIESAYRSLHASRARTLLTMLGILIGVASVTAILALAGGVNDVIDSQIKALGGNVAVVRPGLQSTDITNISNPVAQTAYNTSPLTETDLTSVKSTTGVAAAAPIMSIDASLKTNDSSRDHTVVVATTPELATVANLKVETGEFLSSDSGDNTAVVGQQLAIDLYGMEKPVGRMFTIHGTRFTIIGILARMSNPVNYNNVDFDTAAIIQLTAGKALHNGTTQIQQINIRADKTSDLPAITATITDELRANHLGETDFTVSYGDAVGAPTNNFFKATVVIMTSVAAISLIVGGVGIMNILLVSVAERTREIGIRKAVGATNSSIAYQFLMESLMLSITGGFMGYVTGYVVAFGISTMLYFAPSVNWQTAVAALAMSLIVGLVFGFYPALRAARKHPIESLRQYH